MFSGGKADKSQRHYPNARPLERAALNTQRTGKAQDLGLSKSSEDGHQLLILEVLYPLDRDVQDVDGLLSDILRTTHKAVKPDA